MKRACRKRFLRCALIALCLPSGSRAEFVEMPDPNTLWIENGVEIKAGPGSSNQQWMSNFEVRPAKEGGFVLNSAGDQSDRMIRNVPYEPDFPYLVWEITEFIRGRGYQGFSVFLQESGQEHRLLMQTISIVQKGLFAVRTDAAPTKPMLSLYLYNTELTLKYLKMVKTPDYSIELASPSFPSKSRLDLGDTLTCRVIMAQPAEDVSLTFYHGYTMPQLRLNGEQQLQLEPEPGNPKIWRGSIRIGSCEGHALKDGQPFGPGDFLVKATILGGGINIPLWTANSCEFHLNKPK